MADLEKYNGRSYKDLKNVKTGDMTGAELEHFQRVGSMINKPKDPGTVTMILKGSKGALKGVGRFFQSIAHETLAEDNLERIKEIKVELSDLDEVFTAGEMDQEKYETVKANLEAELLSLK